MSVSLLVATFSISSSATQPWLGALADRLDARRVAAVGVALAAISLSLAGAAGTTALLAALLALGGIGSAALHPVATSIVGGPTSANPGLAFGMFTAGSMAGFAAGPVLILYLVGMSGVGVSPWLMVPGLILAVALLVLLPDWEPHQTAATSQRITPRILNGPLGRLTATATIASLAFLTFTSAVPPWLVSEHGLATEAPLLGWVLAAFSLSAGLGAVASGALANRLGHARTTSVSLLAAVIPLTAVLVLPPGNRDVGRGQRRRRSALRQSTAVGRRRSERPATGTRSGRRHRPWRRHDGGGHGLPRCRGRPRRRRSRSRDGGNLRTAAGGCGHRATGSVPIMAVGRAGVASEPGGARCGLSCGNVLRRVEEAFRSAALNPMSPRSAVKPTQLGGPHAGLETAARTQDGGEFTHGSGHRAGGHAEAASDRIVFGAAGEQA
nr:MFS transporter [Micromonospora sp. KC723]